MLLSQILPQSFSGIALLLLGLLSAKLLYNKYGHGISDIPGPWIASWTDLWRIFVVWGRRAEAEHVRLHDKHGSIVRLGPNLVSIGDARLIKTIYAPNSGFTKSDFYPVQQTIASGRCLQTMFNTTNEKYHAKLRRSVSSAYAMSTLVGFEPPIDNTTTVFLKELKERFADNSGVCDLGSWLQYYAFDVIGELTFSKRLGFLERGIDVDRIIGNLEKFLNYVSVVGQWPLLDHFLMKNPVRLFMSKHQLLNSTSAVVEFAKERIISRRQEVEEKYRDDPSKVAPGRQDFLARFQSARAKDPEFITEERVLALTVANMIAGSDTTAISLRSIFYYLLKNPPTMEKLLAELSEQSKAGNFTRDDALVRWEEVRSLPYLSAVINEGLRCHPAAGLTLERVVPAGGAQLAGHFLPGGTLVGCSAWVVHRDTSVFGENPDEFRPERWIEASPERQALMQSCLFSFGSGSRTCIGKNISLLEMFKVVPAVLRAFELELEDKEKPWTLHNAWFVKQTGLNVRFKERAQIL